MPESLKAVILMSLSKSSLQVGVIGAQGIGRFHAGLLQRLGADVVAICCSRAETAQQCADELNRDFGITATPYHRIEEVLALGLDGVSVCTPPQLHYENLLSCLDAGLPVFCEKPLFWNSDDSLDEVLCKVEVLRAHPCRRLFVNTSNTHFLDTALQKIGTEIPIRSFEFSFYTQGPYTKEGIAFDLFPHALSLLLRMYGEKHVEGYRAQVNAKQYVCSFTYGDARISFDFREDPDGPKELFFVLNGRRFTRIQQGFGPTYRVFLDDEQSGDRIEVNDPFEVFLSRFLDYIRNGSPVGADSFNLDAANLTMMAALLQNKYSN